ncbi:CehA/McbA family metallohydrolase [Massilia endophytica]|uniref:CehA/McbA family metallohydrolase n=1 Tax=Massilia endophytica TaxID=2899220 RepID=UPI001E499B6F|nr:CehA/McbA family metallohydrolase [Massilia endophytica]UGQ49003.1 CehA/McbA family metallohydrolase [Massilia endophytica]
MILAFPLCLPALGAPGGDHDELEAWIEAPFRLTQDEAFVLHFRHPGRRSVNWQLQLLAGNGAVLQHWRGEAMLRGGEAELRLGQRIAAAPGLYSLRLSARTAGSRGEPIVQQRQVALGALPAPRLAPSQAAVPEFDIVLGNLHSQTGHSDGGGPLGECRGAQEPQSAAAGPAEAYAYAQAHGLQFLLASEHNHMYDGSEGSDPAADPAKAHALYRKGLGEAAAYSAAHPGFAALYGMEWGVISNGGHLNILNSPELLAWERSADGELMGDTFVAKGDYAALYRLMREKGWIGQFNHPAQNQFRVHGQPLGFNADGDASMALCEVMNSAAFSSRDGEDEKRHSFYEPACQRLLEAGYHLAFSSDQDNHCANWGASYGNRTGVLLPRGTPLSTASLLEAVRARRVFATMDKTSSLVLRANGRMMGERFENSGPLRLQVAYAPGPGRSAAALAIVHGVPGRRGEPDTQALEGDSLDLTPPPGEHYYYARLTQEDGRILWSAPIWVSQRP